MDANPGEGITSPIFQIEDGPVSCSPLFMTNSCFWPPILRRDRQFSPVFFHIQYDVTIKREKLYHMIQYHGLSYVYVTQWYIFE
jgi:hypothetical protein